MKPARSYDKKLLKIAADHPMTADEIGEVVGCYGPDAVTRLRSRKDLRVTIVDHVPSGGRPKNLYRVEKIDPGRVVRGPYCCGFCDQARRATT